MLQKLMVRDLVVGMYVVDTGLSWCEHPYLYSQEGEIRNGKAIQAIVDDGFQEVFIDLEKGSYAKPMGTERGDVPSALLAPDRAATPALRVPIEQEMAAAERLYEDCLSIAQDILRAVKAGGEVDIGASSVLVDDVIASAARNPDALIALSKLRRHDAYTFSHGVNVSVLAVAFGWALDLGPEELKDLGLAGLFHDVGKTGVPDAILNKPGRLTPVEFDRIKMHPNLGRRLLTGRGLSETVLRAVAEHHEKFDGTGYPLGLAGDAVHPWGRILGVADVFDALTSRRSYKEGMLPSKALGVLYGMRGKGFQAGLVERFIKFLGPYPVGSFVQLVSGEYGFVRGSNPARPLFPEVLVAFDTTMRPTRPRLLDYKSNAGPGSPIAQAIDPAAHHLDPLEYLMQPAA
jgi:HD-GYP domain-containing protein (c-di-GMP phosphodiesterase class II)